MKKGYEYKIVSRVNVFDSNGLVHKLTAFAFISVLVSSLIGIVLNYVFRARGEPGGMYIVYSLSGFAAVVLYMYFHEFAHALAIICVTGKAPTIRFGKLVASCGSPFITFSKAQYFFVASFPMVFFCALLIPLCVLLPPIFFPIPFMTLCYNIFGSAGDVYLLAKAVRIPRRCVIVDSGTEMCAYAEVAG